MLRPRVITEEDFQTLLANRNKGMGSVVGTRRESIGCKAATAKADTTSTPRNRPAGALPVRSMPGIGAAGSNPAPSPFSPLTLALTGQLVSGKNQVQLRWHNGKVHKYPNKTFTNWRARAFTQILEQAEWGTRTIITTPVTLTCEYWPGDKRTRDATGMLDAIFHLLVYAKVLKDDGLIWNVWWRRHELNRKFPKVVMEIAAW